MPVLEKLPSDHFRKVLTFAQRPVRTGEPGLRRTDQAARDQQAEGRERSSNGESMDTHSLLHRKREFDVRDLPICNRDLLGLAPYLLVPRLHGIRAGRNLLDLELTSLAHREVRAL